MKIYKTAAYVHTDDEPGYVFIDTIEYEGKFWLVPNWLETPRAGWKKPEKIIEMDLFRRVPPNSPIPADFVLGYPIPITVVNGQTQLEAVVEGAVIEHPEIYVEIPKGIH